MRSIEPTETGARLTLSEPFSEEGSHLPAVERIRVQVRNDVGHIRPGDKIRLRAILRTPRHRRCLAGSTSLEKLISNVSAPSGSRCLPS